MNDSEISYSIQTLPEVDRPRERLLRHGAEALSAVELIAIVLGSGTKGAPVLQLSQALITRFGSLVLLSQATVEELCQVKGIGSAKAIQLRAAFSIGMRLNRHDVGPKFKVESPLHVYQLVRDELENEKRELFMIVMLDAKACLISHYTVAIGTLTESAVHPREVFYPAIRHKAVSLILVHNHPSGDLTPSGRDIVLTQQLVETGATIGIPVNDHIIVGDNGYHSMRQHGEVFNKK